MESEPKPEFYTLGTQLSFAERERERERVCERERE